jgi:dTDP-4-dehydrorhamnose 3,5-epimerase
MIDGVVITPLKQIFDERGKVMHMLRTDSSAFQRFGEIYFSCVEPGAVKAWHLHREMTLNYAVVHELFLSPENYCLVTIPPLIWNGFKGMGESAAIVANCATIPHDPKEIERKDPLGADIPYLWDIKHA